MPEDEVVWFNRSAPGILEFGKWRECAIGFIHGFLLSLEIVGENAGYPASMDQTNTHFLPLTLLGNGNFIPIAISFTSYY